MEVATRIIATEGARRFTVQALATELEVTGGAIYRHFPSMEAIADVIVEGVEALLFEGFPPTGPTPMLALRRFFLHRARTIAENPHVARLLFTDNLHQACGVEYAERLATFKRRTQMFVLGTLVEAKEQGLLLPDTEPKIAALLVVGTVHALAQHATDALTTENRLALAGRTFALLERGLTGSFSPPDGTP